MWQVPTIPSVPGLPEPSILQWAMQNGPLAVVLLLILHVYRRDMLRMQAKEEEKTSILTNLVGDCKASIATNTAQTQQAGEAINRLTNLLQGRIRE